MTRTRASALNFAAGVGFTVMTLLVGLWATPRILGFLGEARYGAVRAGTDLLGYTLLCELGYGGALLAVLARRLGAGTAAEVAVALRSAVRTYLRIGTAMIVLGVVLAGAAPWIVRVPTESIHDLRIGLLIGILGVAVFPLTPFRALTEAGQRGYLVNLLLIAQSLLIVGQSLLYARWGWGIKGQFLAGVLGALPLPIVLAVRGLRHFPWSTPISPESDSAASEISGLNTPSFITSLAGRVSFLTDNLVISGILGAAAVTPFFVTQRLTALFQSQLTGIGSATWASLANLHASGQQDKLNLRFIELTRIITILGVAGLVPIAAYNRAFVTLWVGSQQYAGDLLTILALLNGLLLTLYSLWGWMFSGTGHVRAMVPISASMAGINLLASIISTRSIGAAGPILGNLIAFILAGHFWIALQLRRVFNTPLRQLFMAVAVPGALGLPYAAAVWWLSRKFPPANFAALLGLMAMASMLFLAVAWFLIFNRSERRLWVHRIQHVFQWSKASARGFEPITD